MFTGIIEELGTVQKTLRQGGALTLTIRSKEVVQDIQIGQSVAVNGVCLTVTNYNGQTFVVQAVEETLQKSTLGRLRISDRVNLERALKPSQRLGGHIVTGHVDGIGIVRSKEEREKSVMFTIDIPLELSRYIVIQGSVAVDGVSLTVADFIDSQMAISIVPHTAKVTTFGFRKGGDKVNIEVDLIGKYVERFVTAREETITEEWLGAMGYSSSS